MSNPDPKLVEFPSSPEDNQDPRISPEGLESIEALERFRNTVTADSIDGQDIDGEDLDRRASWMSPIRGSESCPELA